MSSELFEGLFEGLVELGLRASALLLVAVAVDRIARGLLRTSAATRASCWALAFAGVLALVPLGVALPSVELAWLPPTDVERWVDVPGKPAASPTAALAIEPRSAGAEVAAGSASFPWREALFGLWALVASIGMLRLALQVRRARRLIAGARPLDGGREELRVSVEISTPLVAGVLRPLVLVGPDFASWEPERARAVLDHELAHLRRRDPLTSLLVAGACWLLWFQPLAWYGRRRFRVECERACDDAVLAGGGRQPHEYARDLLTTVRELRAAPRASDALGAVTLGAASRAELESRLRSILDESRPRRSLGARGLAAGFASTLALSTGLASLGLAGAPPGLEALLRGLGSADAGLRAACLEELGDCVTREEFSHVAPLALDGDPRVRTSSLRTLRRIGCLPAMMILAHALEDDEPEVRRVAASELRHFRDPSWWRAREARLRDEYHPSTAAAADFAFVARRSEDARDALRRACSDPDPTVAAAARETWARVGLR